MLAALEAWEQDQSCNFWPVVSNMFMAVIGDDMFQEIDDDSRCVRSVREVLYSREFEKALLDRNGVWE